MTTHRSTERRLRPRVASGVLLLLFAFGFALLPARASTDVTLLYFGTETCPYCQLMEEFLDELEATHGDELTIERHDVGRDPVARQRWGEEMAARGHQASGVPVVILDETVWLGFEERNVVEIEAAVAAAVDQAAPPTAGPDEPAGPDPPTAAPADGQTIAIPLLGEVALDGRSPVAVTSVIAFVDGFNPCSLWVLTVLLAMVLHAGATRARVAVVGGTFLLVTGALYGAFIVGIFTVMGYLEHLGAIRLLVAALALFIGAVNVKDYFAYKRGLSFTIPDRFKPRIYRSGRAVRDRDRSLASVIGLTVGMAAGISLVELPCTAGFPVIWTGIVRTQGIEGVEFAALLLLYLAIYVLVELVVFGVALVTLRTSSFEERHGRALKLVGGAVMIALGVVLVAAPQLMESFSGAMLVVAGAVVLALVLAAVRSRFAGPPP